MIVCPVEDPNLPMQMLGDPGAMVSKHIQFNVEWCDKSSRRFDGKNCKEKDQIKDFIYDMGIETWVVNKKMNFTDKLG